MRCRYLIIVLLLSFQGSIAQNTLLSPEAFLGYALGERFTSHERAVAYYQHVAEHSPNAILHTYGETYEHRPLIYVVVSSSENIKNIEQIRNDNLRRAGMEKGNPSTKKAIVWMSYNVHGNEASGVEAALRTLYEVANPENKNVQHILNNLIIVFDPCLNPD
jgi:hypothetical protein